MQDNPDKAIAIMLVAFSPFSMIASLTNVLTILYFQKRRLQSDVLLMASIYQFIGATNFLWNGIYFFSDSDTMMSRESPECRISSFLEIVCQFGNFVYSVTFAILITFKIQASMKNKQSKRNQIFHIIAIGLSIVIPTIYVTIGYYGQNSFQICGMVVTWKQQLLSWICFITFGSVSIYGWFKINLTIPGASEVLLESRKQFVNYYIKYFVAYMILWAIVLICDLAYLIKDSQDGNPINFFQLLQVATMLSFSIVLFVIRYKDRKIHKKIVLLLMSIFTNQNQKDSQSDEKELSNQNQCRRESNPEYFLSCMVCKIKLGMVVTMLGSISVLEKEWKQKSKIVSEKSESEVEIQDVQSETISEVVERKISLDIIQQEDQGQLGFYDFQNCKVISYYPTHFQILQSMERDVDVAQSFNVLQNKDVIMKFAQPSGGKSGEFFFFSQDSKLMIKTLSNAELQVMLDSMKQYMDHFIKNPDSLIAKILGLYSFKRQGSEAINVMIMKSLVQVPRNEIIRTYDLKGSTYDRQVLKKSSTRDENQLNQQTLKDLDFFELEEYVRIKSEESTRIREILTRDCELFRELGLMDYSLLLIKMKSPISRNYIVSTEGSDIYYAFGIIDYLQKWNVEKNLERRAKQLMNRNMELDTSAQEPGVYAQRFQNQLLNKIFQQVD